MDEDKPRYKPSDDVLIEQLTNNEKASKMVKARLRCADDILGQRQFHIEIGVKITNS
jgi:hypothetical protein